MRKFLVLAIMVLAALWVLDPFSGDELPEATDAQWVAEQRAVLKDKRVTTGRFRSTDRDTQEVTSGLGTDLGPDRGGVAQLATFPATRRVVG